MAMSYAALRESLGMGETDVWVSSEYNFNRKYDRVIALSRSGTTTEVIETISKISTPSVVVTAIDNSPIAEFTKDAIANLSNAP